MKAGRWIRGAALVVALAIAGAWYAGQAGAGESWRVHAPGAGLWLLAGVGLFTSYLMRALRLRAEWRGERDLSTGRCLQVILMHAAAVNLLPMRSGELGFPWLLRRYGLVAWEDAAASLLWMRLQDAALLAWLVALSALGVLHTQGRLDVAAAAALAVCASLLLVACALFGARWGLAVARRFVPRPEAARGARKVMALVGAAAARASSRANSSTWAWSLGNWIVKTGALGALLAGFAGLGWPHAWCAALGGEVAAALPVQPPAGFGSYEAAVVLGGAAAHASPAQPLLVAALAVHLFVLAASLAGAAVAWAAGHQSAARDARSGDAA